MGTDWRKRIKGYGIMMILAVITGLSYELFIFPNAFAPAGINGLATMVQYVFHVSIGYLSLIINIPLILLAWARVGKEFAEKTLVFVLAFSATTILFNFVDISRFAYYTANGNSAILGPVVAGVISGGVYGLAIRQNGCTGGTDILAAWVRKKHPEASLVWVIFGLNASVAILSYFVYEYQFEPVILCLMYCYLTSKISDNFLKGGKKALKFEVVTEEAEALSHRLFQELRHGVTVVPALGMYSEEEKNLLVCVVNRHQIVKFQEILSQFPGSFAYVSEVNETMGNFKRITG